mmetsp:Transcript_33305/g.38577  ORF Transcript_33305/g.38577 Transcript_33305/m.38577 type:complete len:546 (-) Transcript_33305:180-1817(-)
MEKKLPSNFTLRSFKPDTFDEADCALLDERANQHKTTKLPVLKQLFDAIQVYPTHPKGFHGSAVLLSQEHEILVIEDNAPTLPRPRVVAVVCCTINWVSPPACGTTTMVNKVGWVYGLRVDESYQRRGLGSALQAELERRCRAVYVDMIYLTVNDNNVKAKSLYQALGYHHASHRKTSTKILHNVNNGGHPNDNTTEGGDDVLVVRMTDANAAAAIITQRYKDCDLCPISLNYSHSSHNSSNPNSMQDGFVKLFHTTANVYEGTFLAVKRSELPTSCLELLLAADDTPVPDDAGCLDTQKELQDELASAIQQGLLANYGAISLWNSSALKGFRVVRVGFRKETWLYPWFQSALWAIVITILLVWSKRVVTSLLLVATTTGYVSTVTWWLWTIVPAVLELLLLGMTQRVATKAYTFFRFVVTRDLCKLQVRAFAPCHLGVEGMDCLRAAVGASQVHAKGQGFGFWALNVDGDHPYATKFGKGFCTQFLQKWLVPKNEMSSTTTVGNHNSGDDTLHAERDETGVSGAVASTEPKPFLPSAFCDPRHF